MDEETRQKPILIDYYEQFLIDQDSSDFIRSVSHKYTCSTLERMVSFGDRVTRRAVILALGYLGDYSSNAIFGRALIDRDRGVRTIAENGIRELWCRVGSRDQRQTLRTIIRLNESNQHEDAVRLASELIHESPWIAEAWYQRGTAYYHQKQYDAAIRDCHQSLEINPYQFMAAAGMGQCYLLLDDPVSGLDAFRRALRLNPSMEEVRAQVIQLQRSIKEE